MTDIRRRALRLMFQSALIVLKAPFIAVVMLLGGLVGGVMAAVSFVVGKDWTV